MRRSIWFWLLIVVVVVVLLGIIFGGYRKGTRTAPAAPSLTSSVVVHDVVGPSIVVHDVVVRDANSLAACGQAARESV